MKHSDFDVIVIGGGHAGVEAALASSRAGARTAMITFSKANIGVMSCNPAIGGLGKGHLVREIDALGGVMGLAADYAGIQFRLLNRRKGPAVQGPRAQTDRKRYQAAIQQHVSAAPNLSVIESEVIDLAMTGSKITGVVVSDGSTINSRAVVVTTGTFLRGVIHIGDQRSSGGRIGDKAANQLAQRFDSFGLTLGRLKTGTPPRLDGTTIDWSILESQPGDEEPELFSFLSDEASAEQISCGITHTNEQTHQIIHENLEKSAMYGGHIDGTGPRYCPSIEDKVVRFADKQSHQVFLEPEGLDTNTVYPNGISTSLPLDVQEQYVRSIRGLESAVIEQPGYAIEYDYVDPRSLNADMCLQSLTGLYLAGQINGTTGYEEAAAQGLLAGLNAARFTLDAEPITLKRSEAYMGVMIDDLVTRGVLEPYRMFTSRAEFRLQLRADNADQRLTPLAIELGLVTEDRIQRFSKKMECLDAAANSLGQHTLTPSEAAKVGLKLRQDGKRRSASELLAFPDISFEDLLRIWPDLKRLDATAVEQVSRDALYSSYISRQQRDVEVLAKDEAVAIPIDLDFGALEGLSTELKQKLQKVRPNTLAQAGRIDGMTPAALTLILAHLKSDRRLRA